MNHVLKSVVVCPLALVGICFTGCSRAWVSGPGVAPAVAEALPGLQLSATLVNPDSGDVSVVATLRNVGSTPVGFAVGGCPILVRAYRVSSDRSTLAGPVWNSLRHRACSDVRRPISLAPGATQQFEEPLSVLTRQTSSTLAPAEYDLTVSIRFSGRDPSNEVLAGRYAVPTKR